MQIKTKKKLFNLTYHDILEQRHSNVQTQDIPMLMDRLIYIPKNKRTPRVLFESRERNAKEEECKCMRKEQDGCH